MKDNDTIALEIARRFVPADEPQKLAELQVAIVGAIETQTPTMDVSLFEWLKARDLLPDADTDGCVEMDDVIAALNEHERQLSPDQQAVDVGFGPELIDRNKRIAELAQTICDNTRFNIIHIPASSLHAFAHEIRELVK